MQMTGIIRYAVGASICFVITACAGHSQPAKDPSTHEEPTQAPAAQPEEPVASGSGVDVGMQFEDKGESTQADRTPPPTPAYKPGGKSKPASTPP